MQEASETGSNNWTAIAKKVGKHAFECMEMFKILLFHKKLGKVKMVKENGVKVFKCPPAWCRGVSPGRNVGGKS